MPKGRPKKHKITIIENDMSLEEQEPGQSNVQNSLGKNSRQSISNSMSI